MGNSIQGTIKPSATTVTTTAAAIPASALEGRRTLLMKNNGAVIVYLGDSTVTIANGYPLEPAEEKAFDIEGKLAIYGITEADDCEVRILEGA